MTDPSWMPETTIVPWSPPSGSGKSPENAEYLDLLSDAPDRRPMTTTPGPKLLDGHRPGKRRKNWSGLDLHARASGANTLMPAAERAVANCKGWINKTRRRSGVRIGKRPCRRPTRYHADQGDAERAAQQTRFAVVSRPSG
jgi:hypothetical protein